MEGAVTPGMGLQVEGRLSVEGPQRAITPHLTTTVQRVTAGVTLSHSTGVTQSHSTELPDIDPALLNTSHTDMVIGVG